MVKKAAGMRWRERVSVSTLVGLRGKRATPRGEENQLIRQMRCGIISQDLQRRKTVKIFQTLKRVGVAGSYGPMHGSEISKSSMGTASNQVSVNIEINDQCFKSPVCLVCLKG